MKTLELAKKAVTRIAEVAVTQAQFDNWGSKKQRQWLKDHPTSKFGRTTNTPSSTPVKPKAKKIEETKEFEAKHGSDYWSGSKAETKEAQLQKDGFKRKKDKDGGEYEFIYSKPGSPETYRVNYRFGKAGTTYIRKSEAKEIFKSGNL